MALTWHPDKNNSPQPNDMMRKVNEAYKELTKHKKGHEENEDHEDQMIHISIIYL